MCLIAIDGTWSDDFNNKSFGLDARGKPVGNQPKGMSNTRKFFVQSSYPTSKKFYFAGPEDGPFGTDVGTILNAVLDLIERTQCSEVSLVGWSRGAVIATEVAEALFYGKHRTYRKTTRGNRFTGYRDLKNVPKVRFLGLFDAVAMTQAADVRRGPAEKNVGWGEDVHNNVQYFAHVIAGLRDGPFPGVPFYKADPEVHMNNRHETTLAAAKHGDIGGFSSSALALQSYKFIRDHATKAGVL